jgi:hypothetical protein
MSPAPSSEQTAEPEGAHCHVMSDTVSGNASATCAMASDGPAFRTVIVHVMGEDGATTEVPSSTTIEMSA